MKRLNILLGLCLLSGSALAGPMKSIALQGDYTLNKVVKDNNAHRGCPQLLTVEVNESVVRLFDTNDKFVLEVFSAKDEGWDNHSGDIGPWRYDYLRFNKNSVKATDSQPISLVGYVSETRYAKLNRKGQLIVGEESTLIPFGVLPIDYEYKCIYDRL